MNLAVQSESSMFVFPSAFCDEQPRCPCKRARTGRNFQFSFLSSLLAQQRREEGKLKAIAQHHYKSPSFLVRSRTIIVREILPPPPPLLLERST